MVQLGKYFAIVRGDSNNSVQVLNDLKGVDSTIGTKAIFKEIKHFTPDRLLLTEHGIDQTLSLTKNKFLIQHSERKMSALYF